MLRTLAGDLAEIASLGIFLTMIALVAQAAGGA
jgi:hypothetical protein